MPAAQGRFREKVRALRKRLGASQSLFAEAVGIKAATLRSWEGGRFEPGYPDLILAGLEQKVGQVLATKGKLGSKRRGRKKRGETNE